jgi:hypothetical protein
MDLCGVLSGGRRRRVERWARLLLRGRSVGAAALSGWARGQQQLQEGIVLRVCCLMGGKDCARCWTAGAPTRLVVKRPRSPQGDHEALLPRTERSTDKCSISPQTISSESTPTPADPILTASPPSLTLDISAVNSQTPLRRRRRSMTSPNAKTREETQAAGEETFGVSTDEIDEERGLMSGAGPESTSCRGTSVI